MNDTPKTPLRHAPSAADLQQFERDHGQKASEGRTPDLRPKDGRVPNIRPATRTHEPQR